MDWKDLGILTIGTSDGISERVKQYLKDQEKILSRLTPKYILDRTFAGDENEKGLRDIYELFLKTPGMSVLENENVLFEAVKEGVRNGIIGLKEGNEVYHKQDVLPTMDSIILRGEVAVRLKESEARVEGKEEKEQKVEELELKKEREIKKEDGIVKKFTLVAKIQWDQVSSLMNGVIRPLKDKGQPPEITIKIEYVGEFDRTTLDTKVKETLNQIGAEIKEWNEE